jgi:hypothetical protein
LGDINQARQLLDIADAWQHVTLDDPNSVLATQTWQISQSGYSTLYNRFRARFALFNIRLGNDLYWNITGLGPLRKIIEQVSSLLGQPPPPLPSGFEKYASFSLQASLTAVESVDPGSRNSGSLRGLATSLNMSAPISMRLLYNSPGP